jgi:hypothetical protein
MTNRLKIVNRDISNITVIGDIHACYDSLVSVVNQSVAKGITKFLSVGDLLDRGTQAVETIQFVYDLIGAGDLVICVGNHDMKFLRHFSGAKVNLALEQQATLKLLNDDAIDKFKKIFTDVPTIAIYDSKKHYFISHAFGCRPQELFLKQWRHDPVYKNTGGTFTDFLNNTEDKLVERKHSANLLYGMTNGKKEDGENGRPIRLPISRDIDDDMDGWSVLAGHHHSNCFYPENGNKKIIGLDWSSGEKPHGKLAALIIPASGQLDISNLIFSTE